MDADPTRRARAHLARPALLALTLALAPAASPAQGPAGSYDSVYAALRRLAPRPDRVAEVRDLAFARDAGRFRLAQGSLSLLTDVGGRTVGAAFVGTGTFAFAPPTAVERAQLRRILGDSALDGPITAAVFLFADSTLAQLERQVRFGEGARDPAAEARVGDALDFLVEGRERWVDPGLMEALLDGATTGWFAAYVKRAQGEDLMVVYDPADAEEVRLLRRGRQDRQRVETVSQFQREADVRDRVAAGGERPDAAHVEEYRIDSRIGGNYEYAARAVARLAARRPAGPWLRFRLYSDLRVDSVLDEGAAVPFWRADDNADLWVRAAPLAAGAARSLTFVYHGKLIEYRGEPGAGFNWAYILSTTGWYPRYGADEPARLDLTYHTPRDMRFASVGRLADTRTDGDVVTTHWVTERPTDVASFNIGDLDTLEVRGDRIPPTTILYNREAHRTIRHLVPSAFPGEQWLSHDVANSLSFFTERFGAPPFQRYWVTEIPYSHGQAFPGLIHLAWSTFLGVSNTGGDESFRAHEIAHQWWGIGVEPATYRDWWLSEGFAEFAGLWYMQMVLRNNDLYFRRLRESRQAIRRERERMAPTALGPRATENAGGQYELAVYQKGAWVLHMLRNMMLDFQTMSDDRFSAMLRDFYRSYDGRTASTADFQRVVERHIGAPMDWFFREWVEGTAVPTYTWSWRADRQADGRFLVRLRVRQEDVPPDFEMDVPLHVALRDSNEAYVKVLVKGPLTETQFALPGEPRRLELNPLESVLAEVRQERWR